MSDSPYRRDAELSGSMLLVGAALFSAALAVPFGVIALSGGSHGPIPVAEDDGAVHRVVQTTLPEIVHQDRLVLASAQVGPVSVIRPRIDVEAPKPTETVDAGAPDEPVMRSGIPAKATSTAAPDTLTTPRTATAKVPANDLPHARAPRIVPALAHAVVDEGTALPVSLTPEHSADLEKSLAPTAATRREIQLRLALLGHNPRGVDGIFGEQTRAAIRSAQAALDLPETGYLDPALHSRLLAETDDKLARYRADARKRAKKVRLATARRNALAARAKVPTAKNSPGCRRNRAGRIKENQGFSCDWALLGESLSQLFNGDI